MPTWCLAPNSSNEPIVRFLRVGRIARHRVQANRPPVPPTLAVLRISVLYLRRLPENRCWQESLTGRQGQVRPSLILECPAPAVPQREHVRSRNSSSLFCSQGSNDLNNPNQNTNQQVNDEVVSRQSLSIPTETIQNPNQRTAVLLKHCSGYPESDRTNARQATSESRPHQFPERGP